MDNYFLLYLWTRLDVLHHMFGLACIIVFAIVCMSVVVDMCYTVDRFDNDKAIEEKKQVRYTAKKYFKRSFITFIILMFFFIIIPSQKDIVTIYILPKVANHSSLEEWDKVLNSMPKAIQNLLEEYIPEQKEKKSDK